MIKQNEQVRQPEGMEWKTTYSVIVGLGWLIFLIIWLFFYSEEYTINQNIGILILSFFVIIIILCIPWMFWGVKFRTEKEKEMWKTKGFAWRVYLSVIAVFLFMIFLVFWFFFYADTYNICQNLAILMVIILFSAGLIASSWVPWGIRYGDKFDDKHWQEKEIGKEIKREIGKEIKKEIGKEIEKEIEREIERRVQERVKKEMEKIKSK